MKRLTPVILLTATVAIAAIPAVAQSAPQSFQEFRKGLLNDYSSFREGVLKDYAKFLDNVWVEYDRFKGEERNPTPKPEEAPAVPEASVEPIKQTKPEAPDEQEVTPPAVGSFDPKSEELEFDFHGMTFTMPDVKVKISHRLSSAREFAGQWRELAASEDASQLVKNLSDLAADHQFNDYLTFDMVKSYVSGRYGGSVHSTSLMSLCHFILANMGYGARLGLTGSGDGLLLIPFRQMVYGRPYMKINDTRYFIFADTDHVDTSVSITTCKLPDSADVGRELDLRITTPPMIPYKAKPFRLSAVGLELTGSVNANLFPMLYRYPQMEMADYASAVLDPELRADLVAQLKSQLAGKGELDAVNALLQFTQSAFEYATDERAHGFEKPYFFEETLYYPQCDCEDRAIFYTYLLWHVLGVENQMITYPGHESASVCLKEEIKGDKYTFDGRTFYISDPTYIGSRTGQCMPDFIYTKPEIEHHYR